MVDKLSPFPDRMHTGIKIRKTNHAHCDEPRKKTKPKYCQKQALGFGTVQFPRSSADEATASASTRN